MPGPVSTRPRSARMVLICPAKTALITFSSRLRWECATRSMCWFQIRPPITPSIGPRFIGKTRNSIVEMTSPPPLKSGVFYHIYHRGTNREDIFVQERNYRYFLQLYARHIEPAAETYAYCLLKNHFHVLVRIKDVEDPKGLRIMSLSL